MRKQVLAGASAALVAIAIQFNVYAQHGGWAETGRQAFLGPAIDLRRFPVEHADFLESTGFEGNIFCQGNWGGYLLWRLWPQVRVTADGRGNYARDVTEALDTTYDRSRFGDPAFGAGLDAIYRRYPVDAIVHQHPIWPAGYEVDRTHWVPVFQDRRGAVWIRNTERGQAYLEKLRAARAGDPTGAPSSSPE